MIRWITARALFPVATFLIVLVAVTLVWCGDAECWTGESEDECTSLLCSLLSRDDPGSGDQGCASSPDCTCTCHLSIIPVSATVVDYHPPVFNGATDVVSSVPPPPIQPIYHPPIEA